MTMAAFSPEHSAHRPIAPPRPRRVSSGISVKIDRAIRYARLWLERYDLWATCLCAVLACLTWIGLGMVLFGQPLPGTSALDCSSTIECAVRTLYPLP